MITIEKISPDQFIAMRQQWNDFLLTSNNNCLFLTWEWLSCWWQVFAASHRHFYFLQAKNSDGQIIGLFPFQIILHRKLALLKLKVLQPISRGIEVYSGGTEYSTSQMCLLLPGLEHNAVAALASFLEVNSKDWDLIYLDQFVEGHLFIVAFYKEFIKHFLLQQRNDYINYFITLLAHLIFISRVCLIIKDHNFIERLNGPLTIIKLNSKY